MQAKALKLIPVAALPAAMVAGYAHAPALLRFALAGGRAVSRSPVCSARRPEQLSARLGAGRAAGLLNATCATPPS